jgi:hypothetical protein
MIGTVFSRAVEENDRDFLALATALHHPFLLFEPAQVRYFGLWLYIAHQTMYMKSNFKPMALPV